MANIVPVVKINTDENRNANESKPKRNALPGIVLYKL
jgi:hypothetical protein